MDATIRKAEPRDVPRMLELVRELATFEKEPDAVTVTEAHMLDAGFGKQPVWWGWVAVNDADQILGIAICYERYSTWRGRVGYLEDIVVSEAARGQGIGERLFRACAKECVQRGYHHLAWQVLDWNEGACRFYRRLGAELSSEWLNGRLSAAQLKRIADGAWRINPSESRVRQGIQNYCATAFGKLKPRAFTFAPRSFPQQHLSRKVEGSGPVKPWQPVSPAADSGANSCPAVRRGEIRRSKTFDGPYRLIRQGPFAFSAIGCGAAVRFRKLFWLGVST